jgi:hypothetical protein
MTDQERRYVDYLAAGALVVFVFLYHPWTAHERTSRLTLTGFGVLFAGSFWLLGRLRHRLWAAFGAFLFGLFAPWGFAYIFGAAYVAFAFWLVWRAHRASRSGLNASDGPRITAMPAAAARPTSTSRSEPELKNTAKAKTKTKTKPKATITSGRFTPKKARPKRT